MKRKVDMVLVDRDTFLTVGDNVKSKYLEGKIICVWPKRKDEYNPTYSIQKSDGKVERRVPIPSLAKWYKV